MLRKLYALCCLMVACFLVAMAVPTLRNIVNAEWFALALLIWAIWFYVRSRNRETDYAAQMASAIREVSQVTDSQCIELCRTTAIALNYSERTIYLINDDDIRKLRYHRDIMSWEFTPFQNSGAQRMGDVMDAAHRMGRGRANEGMQVAAGMAVATGATLALLGEALAKMQQKGMLEIGVRDANRPVAWVYIADLDFLKRLQHFFDYCHRTLA